MFDKKETKPVAISRESAKKSIEEFLDYQGIELSEMKENDKKDSIEGAIDSVVIHMMYGRVEFKISDEGDVNVIQTLQIHKGQAKAIDYNLNRLSKAKVQTKSAKENDGFGKMHALMGSLSGLGSDVIINLKGKDARAMEALSVLFFV